MSIRLLFRAGDQSPPSQETAAQRASGPFLRERVGEPHEIRNGQCFAARARCDTRTLEVAFVSKRLERIAQRLAPLAEGRGDESREQRFVDETRTRVPQR